uniref:Uncharacterized protein n=1 Tax=Rhizophora mucronata TaxID=61149 RepID=A0A2P2NXP5_RHIMU
MLQYSELNSFPHTLCDDFQRQYHSIKRRISRVLINPL